MPDKEELNLLDVYHGKGLIWKSIINQSSKKINVLGIDEKVAYTEADKRAILGEISNIGYR